MVLFPAALVMNFEGVILWCILLSHSLCGLQSLLSILAMFRKKVVPDHWIKVIMLKTQAEEKQGGISFVNIRRNEEHNSKPARWVEVCNK